nr:germin-like protein 9-3 [Quercus suber]
MLDILESKASKTFTMKFFTLLVSSLATIQMAIAGDPDILSDFIVPANVTTIDASFFTFTGMRFLVPATTFKVSKISLAEFPALNGQSVSYAVLQFPTGTPNPPHIHPCASELIFLSQGTLQVGIVDTTNKLFTHTLQKGDVFVFPKGLVHSQYNADPQEPALAIPAFGSANAGTVSLPNTLFTTGIDDNVLAKSFKTDVATIQALKAGLAPKP